MMIQIFTTFMHISCSQIILNDDYSRLTILNITYGHENAVIARKEGFTMYNILLI